MSNILTRLNPLGLLNRILSTRKYVNLTVEKKYLLFDIISVIFFNAKSIYFCDKIRQFLAEREKNTAKLNQTESVKILKGRLSRKSKLLEKKTAFFDSYWLFSVGHIAVLLGVAKVVKRKKLYLALNLNYALCADNSVILYLKKFLGKKILVTIGVNLLNNLYSQNPNFPKFSWQIKRKEFFSSASLKPPNFAIPKIHLILPKMQSSNHMVMCFHLRNSEFRGWKSYRDGLHIDEYFSYFEFLDKIKIFPIVFSLAKSQKKPFFYDALRAKELNTHNQIQIFNRANFTVGSSSGLTHFGPIFNRPTIYFDMIRPITMMSKKHTYILFKNFYEKNTYKKNFYAPIKERLFLNYDEQEKYDKSTKYNVQNNTSENLIQATIELLFFSPSRQLFFKKIQEQSKLEIENKFSSTFQSLKNMRRKKFQIQRQIKNQLDNTRRKNDIKSLAFFEDIAEPDQILLSNFL